MLILTNYWAKYAPTTEEETMAMKTVRMPEDEVIKRFMVACEFSEEDAKGLLEELINAGEAKRIPGGLIEFEDCDCGCGCDGTCGDSCKCGQGGCGQG